MGTAVCGWLDGCQVELIPDCYQCIEDWLGRKPECAYCRHGLTLASLLELPPEEKPFVEPEASPEPPAFRSAKVEELIKYLKAFDPADKTLVFSQFTSFLDIVAGSLRAEGIQFCRFDGSMNAKQVGDLCFALVRQAESQRQEVIVKFQRPVTNKNAASNPRVMLISLKSGAVGLNLTAASNVFLVRSNGRPGRIADCSATLGGSLPSKPRRSTGCIV